MLKYTSREVWAKQKPSKGLLLRYIFINLSDALYVDWAQALFDHVSADEDSTIVKNSANYILMSFNSQ